MAKWLPLWRPQLSSHYTPDLSARLLNNGVGGHCSSPIGLAPVGSRPVPDKKDIEEACVSAAHAHRIYGNIRSALPCGTPRAPPRRFGNAPKRLKAQWRDITCAGHLWAA